MHLGARHRARDPRPAEDADEDVLPLRDRLRRGGEHADLPGLPRLPGRAAGAEPDGDRVDDQARARARLRDRARARLRAQELLLPRPARRATRSLSTIYRLASTAMCSCRLPNGDQRDRDRARAPRGGRGQDDPRRRSARAASAAPTTRSSTSTAAARRSSRSSPSPTSAPPRRRSASSSSCGRPSSSSASRTRRWRRGRCASTPTSRCGRGLQTSCARARELKNMNSFNFIARGIEAEIERQIEVYEVGRRGRAGDLRLRRRDGGAHAAPRQGGGGRLPLLPGARPRPRRAARRARRAAARRAARAARRAHPPDRAGLDLERALVPRHERAATGSGARRWPPARTRPRRQRDRTSSRRRRRSGSRSIRAELAKLIDARERIPRDGVQRGVGEASASQASRPEPFLVAGGASPTRRARAGDRRASSTRTRARSSRTAAARRACSASSSAR